MGRDRTNWTKKTVLFLKNNYSWLSIIPVIIGGLYQFLCISSIGYQYLRFFSLTQFLIDGVLLICIFSLFIISFLMYFYTTHQIGIYKKDTCFESYADEIKRRKNERSHFIFTLILLIPLTFYLGYKSYKDIIGLNFSYNVFLFSFSLIVLIFVILNKQFKLGEVNYWSGIGYHEKSRLRSFLHACMHLFFYFQFFFLMYAIGPVVKSLKSFSLSDLSNTHNFTKYIECNKKQFKNFQAARIIYYNDKYLFSEIITKKDTIIKIDSFESFISETCNIK